jgi:hypothetical protein
MVPVTIEWHGTPGSPHLEGGVTRVVNIHGCLLVSPQEIEMGQALRLTNDSTRRTARGAVVWKGGRRHDGWELGVEFVGANLDFWGIEL